MMKIWIVKLDYIIRFIFVYQKSLNKRFKPVFEYKSPLNLYCCAVNSQRLLCSQKAGVKCS